MEVTGDEMPPRSKMKDTFLGMTYGLTPNGMSKRYDIPKSECVKFLDAAHHILPHASAEMERLSKSKEMLTTMMGRDIHLNPYMWNVSNTSRNYRVQSLAEAEDEPFALRDIETVVLGFELLVNGELPVHPDLDVHRFALGVRDANEKVEVPFGVLLKARASAQDDQQGRYRRCQELSWYSHYNILRT